MTSCSKDLYDKYMLFSKSEAWCTGRFLTELALSEMNGYTNDIFCKAMYDTYLPFAKSEAW